MLLSQLSIDSPRLERMTGEREKSFYLEADHGHCSDDVPDVLGGMAKLATCNTGTETVVADTDRFVLELIGKVILAFCHGTYKDTHTFFWPD